MDLPAQKSASKIKTQASKNFYWRSSIPGTLYSVSDQLDSKTLITYTKNFGSPLYSELFSPGKTHIYCLQQFSYELYKYNLNINAAVGLDFGQLNHNNAAGLMLGVQWTLP